jgi:2-oxo-4-hydroxy-4-carboxy-5-ureidoimidazoline decarboxylase
MTGTLARWNDLPSAQAAQDILRCCGSTAWAEKMAARKPFADEASLLAASDETWRNLTKADWMEAFRSHPRIGGSPARETEFGKSRISDSRVQSAAWSEQEQQKVAAANEAVKAELAQANQDYEQRFNHIFIVCATGKSAAEILEILRRRLRNDEETELREAVEQQRLITHIRLKKWLSQ